MVKRTDNSTGEWGGDDGDTDDGRGRRGKKEGKQPQWMGDEDSEHQVYI